tara:strand:- start:487 stop:1212 length:726 start_codon:yes stop_codon:yes gene_type:complete
MIIVEFFGPSGSGKSYFKKKLIKNFSFKVLDYKSLYNLISDRSLFAKFFYIFIKLPFLQKIKNNYLINKAKKKLFGIIEVRKIDHNKLINTEYKLNKKIEFINELILKSEFKNKNKKTLENWANEEIYANHCASKKNKGQKILIDSEGLIQRLFIYCCKKKDKRKIIIKYLDLIEIPQIIIFFDKKKVNKKNEFRIDADEEKKIFNLTLLELKRRNILIINSKIGVNKAYLKIKKNLSYKK